jgi:DNA-binding beta-propeller fold protein YncE
MRGVAALVTISVAIALASCGNGQPHTGSRHSAGIVPEQIVAAPRRLIAVAQPQPNGTIWALAGTSSTGLFNIDSSSERATGSVPVSDAARSVAETSSNVIGLALGSKRGGALELLDGSTGTVTRTVPLAAPARQVVAGSDGTTFYVLTAWAGAASVTVLNSRSGKIEGSVPVPADTVSVAPNVQQTALYALQADGLVDEISVSGGKIMTEFRVGDAESASIALSPDGSTLYVLKAGHSAPNVAVVDVNTESVRRVLPAPSGCLELLVSPTGNQLYEVVGTPHYGNIQIFDV